ncbi:RNA polymerase sigma factor region1.1 domain-containing protein [Bradyrhizobium betae]|uniref:RNA polymerase sigma factor region1.1 domain-containing protein n=1 Tax=Bradyrhizobium betae TaxID=244734 RepID=UPI003D66ABBD
MDWTEVVRKAAILAEKTGYVTFDQLNELMPSTKTEPEDIEAVLAALSDRGIWITEE